MLDKISAQKEEEEKSWSPTTIRFTMGNPALSPTLHSLGQSLVYVPKGLPPMGQPGEIPTFQSPVCWASLQAQHPLGLSCTLCTASSDPHLYLQSWRSATIRDHQFCLPPWKPVVTWITRSIWNTRGLPPSIMINSTCSPGSLLQSGTTRPVNTRDNYCIEASKEQNQQ
jgi:hypothetical protein